MVASFASIEKMAETASADGADLLILYSDSLDAGTSAQIRCARAARSQPVLLISESAASADVATAIEEGADSILPIGVTADRFRCAAHSAVATFARGRAAEQQIEVLLRELEHRKLMPDQKPPDRPGTFSNLTAGPAASENRRSDHAPAVGAMVRERLGLRDIDSVLVAEMACCETDCPDVETVIAMFLSGERHQFRIAKPISVITAHDLVGLAHGRDDTGHACCQEDHQPTTE